MIVATYKWYMPDFNTYEEATEMFDTVDEFKLYFCSPAMIITGVWVI